MADADDDIDVTCGGPIPGVSYPLKVAYCGECTMPIEYCEYGPSPAKCKTWLERNLPDMFSDMTKPSDADGEEGGEDGDGKKRQKRGGKGGAKPVKPKSAAPQRISLSRAPRGKNKFVTVITGLVSCDIDLKVASKYFAQRFACGSSVTGPDEIVIQGDVKDDLFDIIPDKWSHVSDKCIEDIGDHKR